MNNQLVPARVSPAGLPVPITASGELAARHFIDFFTSNIRNHHTREAYGRAFRVAKLLRQRGPIRCVHCTRLCSKWRM